VDELEPRKIDGVLSCMFETRFPFQLTAAAMNAEHRRPNPARSWSGFVKRFPGP
jgi:homogentisate 1,2-dioxygenase